MPMTVLTVAVRPNNGSSRWWRQQPATANEGSDPRHLHASEKGRRCRALEAAASGVRVEVNE
jgi:hypothetical protein